VTDDLASLIGDPTCTRRTHAPRSDKKFSREHKLLSGFSVLVPIAVIYLGVRTFSIPDHFLTVFWASIHILHQAAFIVECYTQRAHGPSLVVRMIDYGLLFLRSTPIATYKFIHEDSISARIRFLRRISLKTDYIFYLR